MNTGPGDEDASHTLFAKLADPYSQILMTEGRGGGGGGLIEVHILYPKKSQLQNLSTQKNH